MYRNSNNTLKIFAFNHNTAHPELGNAANITCKYSIDGGARFTLADTNPTELEDGYYLFNVLPVECDGLTADFFPESSSNNIQCIVVEHNRYLWPEQGPAAWGQANAAQLAAIFSKVHGAPVVLSSTAVNVFSGKPISVYRGSEHSSSTPLGPLSFLVSNTYNVAGWTGSLKIFPKYGSPSTPTISVAGAWADIGTSTQRILFTVDETETDNLDLETEYSYQVELLCGAGHPYASPKGSVIVASVHS